MTAAEWRYIPLGNGSPSYNMAVDEAILTAHSEGAVPPTVRFYGWSPRTLSVGYFQKARDEVDFAELERRGIGFVRRATGGRAVLHDQELTYSIIVSEGYPGIPRSVTEAYRVLSTGLLNGFRRLGLSAEMVRLESEEDQAKHASMGSSACFDSPSWYELVVEGRKIAGSAQTRQKGVVLQHGSILLELDADELFSLLRFSSERVQERMKAQFLNKAVAINDVRRGAELPPVGLEEAAEVFHAGLEEGLGIRLVPGGLTPYEEELTAALIREKYGNPEWSMRR